MQYQLADGWTSVSFVRPAHGLVALHGADVVPVRALGLDAGRTTHGHRFEGSRAPIVLRDADELRRPAARRRRGDRELRRAPRRDRCASCRPPPRRRASRRSTTTRCSTKSPALVERPNVLTCRVRARVPRRAAGMPGPDDEGEPEVLPAARRGRQAHEPLSRRQQHRAGRSEPRIVEGNERVVRPRLADAKFFFDQDRKRTLESRVPGLDKVVYHGKLGSQGDRVRRVRRIAALGGGANRRRRAGARRSRRAARQGRPADRHGRRVPRAAGHHGRLLRRARRRGARGRRGDPRPVRQPARRRRCPGDEPRRRGAR